MNDSEQLFHALQKVHLIEKLGNKPVVWLHDGNGNYFQHADDRGNAAKAFTEEQVLEMCEALDVDTIFELPDNGR